MGGRAVLLVVMGFSLAFLVIGNNFNRMSLSAMDNMTYYASRQTSHNIVLTGSNIACNKFYLNPNWTGGYTNIPCQGGTFTVTVKNIDTAKLIKSVTTVSTYSGYYTGYSAIVYHDTITVTFQPSRFSRYAYYSVSEGTSTIYWVTGDTVKGPMHTQDNLDINGNPYFYGFVSIGGVVNKANGSSDHPTFAGGLQTGSNIPINAAGVSSIENYAITNGKEFTGRDTVYLTFAGDNIKYRYTYKGTDTTKLLSTFAPNGVIFVKNGCIRMQGTVKGQYTVGCSGTNATTDGFVYIDGDLVYNTNPQTNPASSDILGIVAQNNCIITDNTANRSTINIDASIYCQNGSFTAQNYNTGSPRGYINLIGGIIQNVRGPVGTTSGGHIVTGYSKNYSYDSRFMFSSPPNFPNTGAYSVISWFESGLNKATDRNLY
jgi:hypothetical protein